jgi:FG-GAP-like repeat
MLDRLLVALIALSFPCAAAAQLQVTGHSPPLNAMAPVATGVSFDFDRPLDTSSVDADSFRVYGQWSGPAPGTYTFSNGNQTVTLTPDDPFSAGEIVFVNLSHDLRGADLVPLRAAGFAFQFWTATAPSAATFGEIDRFFNTTGPQTRIYGAAATDLNDDGYLDLATINEVSADVRVFLNLADGSGLFGPMLPPQGIGVEASPNAPADFNNDGRVDLCVAAAGSEEVSILLGAGDGTFSSIVGIPIGAGTEPHGIAPLDVDGDGDLDVVNANVGSSNLALLINDGTGTFSGPTFFEGGVSGEYGLAAADMNADGITDLVVAGRNGEEIATMLGNGNGTFTAAGPAQSTGGSTWVVVVGDVDGDGDLDAATANDGSGTVGILLGNGDGTFAAVSTIGIGSHVPAVDLGDLDGDGDLDLVVSSFGGQFWRLYSNNGSGVFSFHQEIAATQNPSCAVLFDFDNDNDLDLALTDELEDEIILIRNGGAPASLCSPFPSTCRTSTAAGKSKLLLKDSTPNTPDARDRLVWKLTKGATTPKADFGDPLDDGAYALCIYEDEVLLRTLSIPAGAARWKDKKAGFSYLDKAGAPDGVTIAKLKEGLTPPGNTKLKVKAKGGNLGLPDLAGLGGVLDVQLQRTDGSVCWGARYSPPFKKVAPGLLKALSDAPPTSLPPPPLWSAIHAQVIGPTCGGCHGGSGGLSGLEDCNAGHASLVDTASSELPVMDRVTPGDPTMSWIMHKLDGTQGGFTAQCTMMFCGQSMPLGSPLLALDVRNAIRTWITNGAINDCP